MASIYGLYDRDGCLRYIGKANNPNKRLKGHMRDAKRRQTPLYNWLKKHGLPDIRILEANCPDWREAERRLIAEARERGERLLNLADGGDQPFCSIEQRRANGFRLVEFLKSGKKADGTDYTNGELVAYAYAGVLSHYKAKGRLDKITEVLARLIEKHSDKPEALVVHNQFATVAL